MYLNSYNLRNFCFNLGKKFIELKSSIFFEVCINNQIRIAMYVFTYSIDTQFAIQRTQNKGNRAGNSPLQEYNVALYLDETQWR